LQQPARDAANVTGLQALDFWLDHALLRQILAGRRHRQLSVLDASDRDKMLGNCFYDRRLSTDYED